MKCFIEVPSWFNQATLGSAREKPYRSSFKSLSFSTLSCEKYDCYKAKAEQFEMSALLLAKLYRDVYNGIETWMFTWVWMLCWLERETGVCESKMFLCLRNKERFLRPTKGQYHKTPLWAKMQIALKLHWNCKEIARRRRRNITTSHHSLLICQWNIFEKFSQNYTLVQKINK